VVESETIKSVVTLATLRSRSCFPSEGGEALHEVEWQKGLTAVAQSQEIREWFVVHVVSRHEKRVAEHFHTRQIDHFLPLYQTPRAWRDGSKGAVRLPLFPGYVFVRIVRSIRVPVLEVPGVLSIVGFKREPSPLSDTYVQLLQVGLSLGKIQPYPGLVVGDRVRLKNGVMTGSEGVLLRKKGSFRVVIALELIMRHVAVEVDIKDVELVAL
jgi:transcription antitermination factor NusG